MTIEATGAPAAPAAGAAVPAAETGAPAPVELVPGSAEHKAAMIAAYDAQFAKPEAAPKPPVAEPEAKTPEQLAAEAEAAKVKTPEELAAEEAAKAAKTPEELAAEAKAAKPTPLGELFESGDFFSGIAADEVPANITSALEAAGLKPEQIKGLNERLKQLVAAEQTLAVQKVHALAGGEAEFKQLNAWAAKNLTPEQREYYNDQLNGPMAAEAMAVLMQRARAGSDPRLATVSANTASPVVAFRDAAEMQAAMRDPRYQTSPAYRAEVGERLRHARF